MKQCKGLGRKPTRGNIIPLPRVWDQLNNSVSRRLQVDERVSDSVVMPPCLLCPDTVC